MPDVIDIEPSFEQKKCIHDVMPEDAHRAHDRLLDFASTVNASAIAGGNLALKMLLLINGGAAISLLTFIGTLPQNQRAATASSLLWFAFGVASGGAGFMFAYLTNYFTGKGANTMAQIWEPPFIVSTRASRRYGIAKFVFHVGAVLACIASFLLFTTTYSTW